MPDDTQVKMWIFVFAPIAIYQEKMSIFLSHEHGNSLGLTLFIELKGWFAVLLI